MHGWNVLRHGLSERVTAHARHSEVNGAEYSGIIDLGHSRRET